MTQYETLGLVKGKKREERRTPIAEPVRGPYMNNKYVSDNNTPIYFFQNTKVLDYAHCNKTPKTEVSGSVCWVYLQ